ncbi:MAG: hypothetical protein ACFE8E_06220 [Candidatus Hodarchaeota archaeon]
MMNTIIDYACAGSQIERIKKFEELRFDWQGTSLRYLCSNISKKDIHQRYI